MISNTNPTENKECTVRQEASAKLRESFLQAISALNGQPCNIVTFEQNRLSANFSGWKTDGTEILVRDLTTPVVVIMPAALLRSSDVIAIEFENQLDLP